MAGDWIPVRTGLANEPEVVRIVSAICPQSVHDLSARVRTTSAVIGALVQTWALFDSLTDDGILHGYTAEWLNAQVGIDGFAENLQHVGWLVLHEQSVEMPGFTTWLGHSAKRRLKDAQRKRAERKTPSANRPQNVRIAADKKRTTGQDRREEDNSVVPNGTTCVDPSVDPPSGSGRRPPAARIAKWQPQPTRI